MSQTLRCFLAFELPGHIRELLQDLLGPLRGSGLQVRWVRPANIHLTVVFLGNIAQDSLERLGGAVSKTCAKYAPFQVSLTGLGYFGSRRSPRVLWVGMEGESRRLSIFRDALQKSLAPFGIKKENRPFRPHLTLGRFRKGATGGDTLDGLLTKYRELVARPWSLNELVLFKSDLRPTGAVYTKLDSWPLIGDK